jgi:phosphatidate cytidylyltransferase
LEFSILGFFFLTSLSSETWPKEGLGPSLNCYGLGWRYFAFLSGSLFGKHKLYPKISPNKTYEGLGGAIGDRSWWRWSIPIFHSPDGRGLCILLAIGLTILGQLGDFTESMLKRSAQVKDSGSLIPGHGGMLDRMDSFLFSAPFLHYFLLYFLKET